jgi:hypothetical protein
MTIPDGSLFQEVGDDAIYLVDEGKRRHIEDPDTFNGVFKNNPNISSVLDKKAITLGNSIVSGSVLVKSSSSDPVYLVDKYDGSDKKWKKRYIPSMAIFDKYQFNQGYIQSVPQATLDGMDDGPNIS